MRKDALLALRISAELKRRLEQIAKREARTLSQISEIFLTLGADQYEAEGPPFLAKWMQRVRKPGKNG
jgi:hypothetical protein